MSSDGRTMEPYDCTESVVRFERPRLPDQPGPPNLNLTQRSAGCDLIQRNTMQHSQEHYVPGKRCFEAWIIQKAVGADITANSSWNQAFRIHIPVSQAKLQRHILSLKVQRPSLLTRMSNLTPLQQQQIGTLLRDREAQMGEQRLSILRWELVSLKLIPKLARDDAVEALHVVLKHIAPSRSRFSELLSRMNRRSEIVNEDENQTEKIGYNLVRTTYPRPSVPQYGHPWEHPQWPSLTNEDQRRMLAELGYQQGPLPTGAAGLQHPPQAVVQQYPVHMSGQQTSAHQPSFHKSPLARPAYQATTTSLDHPEIPQPPAEQGTHDKNSVAVRTHEKPDPVQPSRKAQRKGHEIFSTDSSDSAVEDDNSESYGDQGKDSIITQDRDNDRIRSRSLDTKNRVCKDCLKLYKTRYGRRFERSIACAKCRQKESKLKEREAELVQINDYRESEIARLNDGIEYNKMVQREQSWIEGSNREKQQSRPREYRRDDEPSSSKGNGGGRIPHKRSWERVRSFSPDAGSLSRTKNIGVGVNGTPSNSEASRRLVNLGPFMKGSNGRYPDRDLSHVESKQCKLGEKSQEQEDTSRSLVSYGYQPTQDMADILSQYTTPFKSSSHASQGPKRLRDRGEPEDDNKATTTKRRRSLSIKCAALRKRIQLGII